jgi:hypothetical protein
MNEHEFSYRKELEQLQFTSEQKQQMIAALTKEDQSEFSASKHHRRPFVKIAILSAAALGVLVVGAGATGALKSLPEAFAGIFSEEQTEVADQIGYPIGAMATSNGVTITADAILGDAYNACMVYTIQREDGQPLTTNVEGLQFEDSDMNMTGMGGASGYSYFFDQDPNDNAIQYVESISGDEPLKKGTVKVEFKNLTQTRLDDSDSGTKTLVEGDWKLKFQVNYEDSTVALPAGQTFQQDGMHFAIEELSLSKVGIRVHYTVDQKLPCKTSDEKQRELEDKIFTNMTIQIVKKDGTILDASNLGGFWTPEDGKTDCLKSGMLPEIISLDEVESVIVGGVTVPVAAE